MKIHTFEVSSRLTNDLYYKIQLELRQQDPSKWKAIPNGMLYWGLNHKGILIYMHKVRKDGFFTCYIVYRISARRVINNDNYVGLFNTKKYPKLEKKVNKILKDKCSLLPKLKKCKLKRLDFCINAKLDNQDQVQAYIKTVKRANAPGGFSVYEQYDKISKRKKPTKDDFTVYSSDYIAISIYNKYMEMLKEKEGVFPHHELERAKNIVRIEIRCMDGKIKALKKKYHIKSISKFMSHGNKIGNELYRYYLTKIFNNGEVCILKDALSKIDESGYRLENIELLKKFLKDSNESRSVAETLKEYKNQYGNSAGKHIVELLDRIQTNYVTVTNSDVKLFDNGYIPTPYELYKRSAG